MAWALALLCALGLIVGPRTALAQSPAVAPGAQSQVAFVDTKRLLDQAPQMTRWRERLQREFATRHRELEAEAASIVALKRKRDTDGALLGRTEAEQLTRQITAAERALRRARSELSSLESLRMNEAIDAIDRRIGEAAAKVARERGYNAVLTRESTLFLDPALDLTDAVLEQLRKEEAPLP